MYTLPSINNIYRSDLLPPTNVRKNIKESDKWKKAMLDSLEHIAKTQFVENLKFNDYYRMIDDKMSYQELKDVIPYMEGVQDLLSGVEIPSFLKHHDILGTLILDIVGKYRDLQDKFHVRDVGDIAENEYQQHKKEQILKDLDEKIQAEVDKYMIENGLTPDGKQFNSPEEQQQFLQQMEAEKEKAVPEHLKRAKKQKFKTMGMQWAEVTIANDIERMKMYSLDAGSLKDKLLTGRCFRHYIINPNEYTSENWDPRTVFFSKELDAKYSQDCEYVGRLHITTPAAVIQRFGHMLDTNTQKRLLGGQDDWKNFVTDDFFSAPVSEALKNGFSRPARAPFSGSLEYSFYLGLQDTLNEPLGEYNEFQQDGSVRTYNTFLPRLDRNVPASAKFYADILRTDFEHRSDLCEIVEGYVRCYDLYGFLTYESENGDLVTEEVTEDILPDFLKEKGIKQIRNQTIVDVITEKPQPNTIVWTYRPVAYEGVKIICPNLAEPIYLYFRKCEHQIKGNHMFDIKLPVAGYIGKGIAEKIMPYQVKYNLVENQIHNLLEKEIGILFLMDVTLIPSDVFGWGDAAEALVNMRSIGRDLGILPVQTSGDGDKNQNYFNQFSTHNLSHQGQIEYRIRLAEYYKRLAYEQVGSNPQMAMQPSKYETAEGVRISQEASLAQLSNIYDEFADFRKNQLDMHISVAQYAHSNNIDISIPYTRDDQTTIYLRFSDPTLPLRTIGFELSKNNSKRRELEAFKSYLLQNTNQSPTIEVAKLISSDAMSEVIEIAQQMQMEAMEREQMAHQRQMEMQSQEAQIEEQKEAKKFEREMIKLEREGQIKVNVEAIDATGRTRATEHQSAAHEEIEKQRQAALKGQEISSKQAIAESKLEQEKSKDEFEREMRMKEFNLRTQELKAKTQMKEIDQTIALVNKN